MLLTLDRVNDICLIHIIKFRLLSKGKTFTSSEINSRVLYIYIARNLHKRAETEIK